MVTKQQPTIMKYLYLCTLLFISQFSIAQIRGTVTDANNEPIPFVNIIIEGTYIGTASNEHGKYELNYTNSKNITLIFQSLGYKTQKQQIAISNFPFELDVKLIEEDYILSEVVVTKGENPANEIIRKAIANKKKNFEKTDKFEADFYSRGIFKAKDIPKKILGVEVGDLEGSLDSTRSGVIYLSETVSKIKFQKPNQLKEEIIASKVAGDDSGFSYNTALNTNYDFYENYINFGINMVSPIANNAFNYYTYQLESTFYDENKKLINKIKVMPKRDSEPVFEGYFYVVEDSWAIYGVDLDIKGYRIQEPILETMKLVQNFTFNDKNQIWVKNVQSLEFDAGIFGMKFTGKFTHVFSNYEFKDTFEKKTFGKEIVSFATDANKKPDDYWKNYRPVPLTEEETVSYIKKDSIQTLRQSQTYLDSIDAKGNRFHLGKLITGYTYKNSFKKWSFNYQGISGLGATSFNTVQGWSFNTGFSFRKSNETRGSYTYASSNFNFGLAEDRLRVQGMFYHRFNNQNKAAITISGGSAATQINASEPISPFINTISTLFFKNNFMKLYNREFATVTYGQEVTNGIYGYASWNYENRRALFNTTDYTIIKSRDSYTSNDPLQPENFISRPFDNHDLMKATIGTRIRFGQKYISRPDGKINISNDDYPVLSLSYQKAFGASNSKYHFDFIAARIDYDKTFGNKGEIGLRISSGKFFNADNIAFVDYKHFNGNQTHVNFRGEYLNSFNLLPYYSNSTNDAYIETHLEHNFKGYIMNKIPLLNKLKWNLVTGFHQINVPNFKPYQEFSVGFDNIGFGKFRFLRIDYVRAYQNGYQGDGVMFGLKF